MFFFVCVCFVVVVVIFAGRFPFGGHTMFIHFTKWNLHFNSNRWIISLDPASQTLFSFIAFFLRLLSVWSFRISNWCTFVNRYQIPFFVLCCVFFSVFFLSFWLLCNTSGAPALLLCIESHSLSTEKQLLGAQRRIKTKGLCVCLAAVCNVCNFK